MTICDGDCRQLHAQLSDFVDDGHITYHLCGPCWRYANYFRSIAPKTPAGEQAA